MKRTPEEALLASILDGLLGDEDLSDIEKATHVIEQVDAYRAHIEKAETPFINTLKSTKLEEPNMTYHDEVIRAIATNVIERNTPAVFDESAYLKAIKVHADEVRKAGRSDAQAFADCITTDDIGVSLYQAMRFAKGREVEGDEVQDEVQPAAPKGPANQELARLADAHLAAHPELGKDAFGRPKSDGGRAAAHVYVYGHPDNRDLVARVKAEDLAGIPRTPGGHAVTVRRRARPITRRWPGRRDRVSPSDPDARAGCLHRSPPVEQVSGGRRFAQI